MINRILIRIKVVQILYSYLLSRNEFKIDSAPDNPSRDRRFAYAVYLDMLMLIQELSGVRTNNPERSLPAFDVHPRLSANRVGRALAENPALKEITYRNISDLNVFGPLLQKLEDRITASTVFADYQRKRSRTLDDDARLWTVVLESVVLKDSDVAAALRSNPDFSLTGLHHGVQQAVDTLRAYSDSRLMYQKAKKELADSLDKAYQLYFALFALMMEITDEEMERIEAAKGKFTATAEELNPDTRFIDNALVGFLRDNDTMKQFIADNKFTWIDSPALLKTLLKEIKESEIYARYMAAESTDWAADCDFWRNIIKNVVLPSDAMAEALEEKSIYWNDDLPTIGTFVLKTIRRMGSVREAADRAFLPQFKDDEDEAFGARLFTLAVENRETYREYIDRFINPDWDSERLAFMDIVIMTAAIAEMLGFPGIPVPVTLNEYIEIANAYSTSRSGSFINGILYSVSSMLADEGILKKPFTQKGVDN